jgi:hypothetical protein
LAGAGLLVLTARWLARHPERVRAAAGRLGGLRPLARVRVRYDRQLAFLARRVRTGGALGVR